MKFLFSVLKFVPDSVRGEFINIGAIVGSDESNEWGLRIIDNYSRAKKIDSSDMLPAVINHVTTLASEIDDFNASQNSMLPNSTEINSAWLQNLRDASQNLLQLTSPTPIIANDINHAFDVIFDEFILEPESRRFPFKKKTEAMFMLRKAFLENGLKKNHDFFEKIEIQGPHHRGNFDFAVANGKVVQLSQGLSFQLPNERELAENVKAWAWSVQDIRSKGGVASARGREIKVPSDVDIVVAYIPPAQDAAQGVLTEALSAFNEVGVRAFQADQIAPIGRHAVELLSASNHP